MPIPQETDLNAELDALIADGATDEELQSHINEVENPSAPFKEQESPYLAAVDNLIAQGASDEDLADFLATVGDPPPNRLDTSKLVEKPAFFEQIPEELHDKAFAAYKINGKEGVLKYFTRLSEEDEKYEAELDKIPWLGGFLGADLEDKKNMLDGWDNFKLTIQQAYPNLDLATSRLFRSVFGEENIDDYVDYVGADSFLAGSLGREEQQEAIDAIQILKAQHKDTGAIVGGIKNGDIAGALSGILAGPLNLASTLINTVQTGGAGLFTDMFSETYFAVNEIRAEKLGVTIDELIATGQDSVAAPATFSAVMTALEFAGLKGVGSYVLKSAGKKGIKRLTNWFMANNKEGMTELAQYGLGEAANTWEKTDGDVAATGEAFIKSLATEEAWENYATGFFSGGVISAPKAIFSSAKDSRTNQAEIDENVDNIADLEDVLRSDPSLTDEQRERLLTSITVLKEEGKSLVEQPYRALVNLREDDLTKLDTAQAEIEAAQEEAAAIEADPSTDPAAKEIQLKAVAQKIAENQKYSRDVINESNARVTVRNEAIVTGIKAADKLNKQQEKINEKEANLFAQEKALAAAENPNPAGTAKIALARKKLAKEQKQLDVDAALVPAESNTALDAADNVDQAVEQTEQTQAEAIEARQRNPIDTINKNFDTIEDAQVGEPKVQLDNKRAVKTAREDLEANHSVDQTGADTFETTSKRGANTIANEANQRGLRATVTKAKGGNYITTIGNPTLPGTTTISPTSQLKPDDPFVKQAIGKLQKFFGTALDIEIRPASEVGAFGKVTEENGRVKIIISDGSLTQKGTKLDTLFHEPGHVLYQLFENTTDPKAKKIFKRIEELITETDAYKEVGTQEVYKDLSAAGKRQEAFAKYFGRYAADKTYGKGPLNTVLDRLVKYVNDTFGVDLSSKKLSLNDISDILIADLQTGKSTFFEISEANVLKAFRAARQDAFLDTFELDVISDNKKIGKFDAVTIPAAKKAMEDARGKIADTLLVKDPFNYNTEEAAIMGPFQELYTAHSKAIQDRNDLQRKVNVNNSLLNLDQTRGTHEASAEFDLAKPSRPLGVEGKKQIAEERARELKDVAYYADVEVLVQGALDSRAPNAKYSQRISDQNSALDATKALAQGMLGSRKDTASFAEETNAGNVYLGTYTAISNIIADSLDLTLPDNASLREVNLTRAHAGGTILAPMFAAGVIKITNKWQGGKTYSFLEVIDQEKLNSFIIGASLVKSSKKSVSNLQTEPFVQHGWRDLATGMTAVSRDTKFLQEAFSALDENNNLVQQPALDVLNNYNKTGFSRNTYTLGVAQRLMSMYESILEIDKDGKITEKEGVLSPAQKDGVNTFLFGKKAANLSDKGKLTKYRKMKTAINTFVAHGDKPIYHVHQYAFMGRIHVRSASGSYQATKEELSFQNHLKPKNLTKVGWEGLLVSAADLFGIDKSWYHERTEYSISKLSEWNRIVADPFSETNLPLWTAAKDPFLFLQTIQEITNAMNHKGGPLGYPSSIQSHWDATNSGPMTQVLLTQDAVGAKWVNLIGFEKLQDLYKKLGGAQGILGTIKEGITTETAVEQMKIHSAALKGFDSSIADAQSKEALDTAKDALKAYKKKNKKALKAAMLTYFNQPQVMAVIRDYIKPTSMIKFYSAGIEKMAGALVDKHSEVPGLEDINMYFGREFSKLVESEVRATMPNQVAFMEETASLVEERALNKVGTRVAEAEQDKYVDTVSSDTFSEIAASKEILDAVLPILEEGTVATERILKDKTVKKGVKFQYKKEQFRYKVQAVLPNLPAPVIDWIRDNRATVPTLKATTGALSEDTASTLAKLEEHAANIASKDLAQTARNERANFIAENQEQFDASRKETLSHNKNLAKITKSLKSFTVVDGKFTYKGRVKQADGKLKTVAKEVDFGKFWGKVSKLDLGLPNSYVAWIYANPTEFLALQKHFKNFKPATTETNSTLVGHDANIKELSYGLPTTFTNPYTGFPVRIEPRVPISEQAEIPIGNGKTIQPYIVTEEGNINSSKAYTSGAPVTTLGNDATLPAILGNNKEIDNSATHDSFGVRVEDWMGAIDAIQNGIVDVYDHEGDKAPLREIYNQMTESEELGKAAFDRVFKGTLKIKGNVNNNQHNHSAGKGSKNLADFQDAFVNEAKSTKANELFGNSKSEVFTDSALDTLKSTQAGLRKESWFKDLTGVGDFINRMVRSFIPPQADDYHGLVQRIAKDNQPLKDFLQKEITDKYVKNWHKFVDASSAIHKEFDKKVKALNKAKLRVEKKAPTPLGGVEINNQQAIIASVATDAGLREYGASAAEISALRQYIATNPAMASMSQFLKDKGVVDADTALDFAVTDIGVALNRHVNTNLFNEMMSDFVDAKKNIFNDATMNTLRAKFGNKFTESLQNSLDAMARQNQYNPANPDTSRLNRWLLGSIGVVMFLNVRSAILQMLSVINYATASKSPGKFFANLANPANIPLVKELFSGAYLSERRRNAGFDVNANELFAILDEKGPSAAIRFILKKGFAFTSVADSLAVAIGGAAFIKAEVASGSTQEQALAAWKEQTEEAQQSSRPDRVSTWQRSPVAKFILAFANTPAQYFRLTQKGVRTFKDSTSTPAQKTRAAVNIGMYLVVQNLIFTVAQGALQSVFKDNDEGEEDREKLQDSWLNSVLRGMGFIGAIAAGIITTLKALEKEYEKDKAGKQTDWVKALLKISSIFPPVNKKINQLQKIGTAIKYDRKKTGADSVAATAAAQGSAFFFNVPLDWVQKKAQAVGELNNEQYAEWERVLLLAGWSTYDFKGGKANKKKKRSGSRSRGSRSNSKLRNQRSRN